VQLWRDGQYWVQAAAGGRAARDGLRRLRGWRLVGFYAAVAGLLVGLLFTPALITELRLRSLQQAGSLGPLVVEAAEVRGVPLLHVTGSRPPIYFGEGVPLEKVQWAREGTAIAWQEVPRITQLRQPGEESPLFLFADRNQYVALGQRLWGRGFGRLGWDACVFVGGFAVLRGATGTACNIDGAETRESIMAAIAHELTHQLINAEWLRGSSVPTWFNEGLASYVDGQVYAAQAPDEPVRGIERANYVAQALRFQRYQRLADLKWDTPDGQYVRYAYAHSRLAVHYLVERFGMPAVADLVRRSGPRSFDDTFAAVLGLPLAEFETALEQSLRQTLLAPGVMLYRDEFSSPGRRWRRASDEPARDLLAYQDGESALRVTAESERTQAVWSRLPFGDFQAELDARLTPPVEDAVVFLDVRIQPDDQRYRFSVAPGSGRFALHWVGPTEALPVIESTLSSAIHGGDEVNHLAVRAAGADVILLVNDVEVGRVDAPRHREGRIGFGLSSPGGQPTEARFSNLLVTAVSD
jgi:hypothetical protein